MTILNNCHAGPDPASRIYNKSKHSPGFSLLEIVLVVSLVLTFSVIGIINLSSLQTTFKLRSVADEFKSLLQYGRELAIANKDGGSYSIVLAGTVVKLLSQNKEFTRYQIPSQVTVDPVNFSWNYSTISGELLSCSPCQITLTSKNTIELITVQQNGLVD